MRLADIVENLDTELLFRISRGYDHIIVDALCQRVDILNEELETTFEPEQLKKLQDFYRHARNSCDALGLKASIATIDRLLKLECPTIADIRSLSSELWGRLKDELNETKLLALSSSESELYSHPTAGWEIAINRYPRIADDVEEAARCLACNRGTASVFHLMRVMESALHTISKTIGIPYAPSWKAYLTQIQAQLNLEWSRKSRKLKANEQYIREAHGLLSAVMVAWRNPTVHVRREGYTQEQAKEVYEAVRGFMRHLATKATRKRV